MNARLKLEVSWRICGRFFSNVPPLSLRFIGKGAVWQAVRLFVPVAALIAALEPSAADEPNPSDGKITVAVLPFQNDTGEPEAVHWSSTVSSWIAGRIENLEAVQSRSVNATRFGLRETNLRAGDAITEQQARTIGELIEARRVIWGSYGRDETNWHLRARILNVAHGEVVGEARVAGGHWPQLIQELTLRIAAELGITVSGQERDELERLGTDSAAALEWLSKAFSAFLRQEEFADSERLARRSLAEDPEFASAHAALAAILASQGRFEAALESIRESLRLDPELDSSHHTHSAVLLRMNRVEEAKRALKEALRLAPAAADNLHSLGELYWRHEHDRPAAIAALNRAVELDPFNAHARASLGFAYASIGDRSAALLEAQQAERLDPEEMNVVQMLCSVYLELKDLPAALERHEVFVARARAMGGSPDLVDHFEQRALTIREMMAPQFVSASIPRIYTEESLKATLRERLTPDELRLVVNPMARILEMERWAEELILGATDELEKAKRLFDGLARRIDRGRGGWRTAQEVFRDWNDSEVSFQCQEYARLYVALARSRGLKAFFVMVSRDVQGDPATHACAGVFVDGKALLVDPSFNWFGVPHQEFAFLDDLEAVGYHLNQFDDDIPRKRLAVKLQPDSMISQVNLALQLMGQGALEEAREVVDRALALEPDRWLALYAQGMLAVFEENSSEAEKLLRESLELHSQNDQAFLALGILFQKSNRLAEARKAYRSVVRLKADLDPDLARRVRREIARINETLADGSDDGLEELAGLDLTDEELESDAAELFARSRQAAEQGDAEAQLNLFVMYYQGKGVSRDLDRSIHWLRKAAAQGNHNAQLQLARFYIRGEGMEKDMVAAYKWLDIAAERGHEQAARLRDDLAVQMSPADIARGIMEARRLRREIKSAP